MSGYPKRPDCSSDDEHHSIEQFDERSIKITATQLIMKDNTSQREILIVEYEIPCPCSIKECDPPVHDIDLNTPSGKSQGLARLLWMPLKWFKKFSKLKWLKWLATVTGSAAISWLTHQVFNYLIQFF